MAIVKAGVQGVEFQNKAEIFCKEKKITWQFKWAAKES